MLESPCAFDARLSAHAAARGRCLAAICPHSPSTLTRRTRYLWTSRAVLRVPISWPVYSLQFTVHSLQFTVYSLQFTAHSSQFTVHSSQFTVQSSQFTVHSLQSTAHSPLSSAYVPLAEVAGQGAIEAYVVKKTGSGQDFY
jgi:hypothetical protein